MEPLARLERKQQTTTMAVTRRIRKMLTANTTIITTEIAIKQRKNEYKYIEVCKTML